MNGNRPEQTAMALAGYRNCQEILQAKTRLGWQINVLLMYNPEI